MSTKIAGKTSLLVIKIIGGSSPLITKIASGSDPLAIIIDNTLSILANTASSSPYKDLIIIKSRSISAIILFTIVTPTSSIIITFIREEGLY